MLNQVYKLAKNYNYSDLKLFASNLVVTIFMVKKQKLQKLKTSTSN